MKNLILLLALSFTTVTGFAIDESTDTETVSGEVRVKIEEKTSIAPEVSDQESPKVEIRIVEELDAGNSDLRTEESPKSSNSVLSQSLVSAELTPTNPDKNLVIYFILLMVIVVGIMVLASLIPSSRSRNSQ